MARKRAIAFLISEPIVCPAPLPKADENAKDPSA